MGAGRTVAPRKGEHQPSRVLTLRLPEATGGFLDWLSRNYILGIDAEDVAKFLLIEALEQRSTPEAIASVKSFKTMIDAWNKDR